MKTPWPPLITDAAQSRLVFWRDRALTVLLWVLFFAIFTEETFAFWHRIELVLNDENEKWEYRLVPFFAVAGILVVWLSLWALVTYRRLLWSGGFSPMAPTMSLEAEAASRGVAPAELAAAREQQIVAVTIEGGRFGLQAPKAAGEGS